MTRRELVMLGASWAGIIPVARLSAAARAHASLRIGVAPFPGARGEDCRLGIQLGVDEAKHAAVLFGATLDVRSLSEPSAGDAELTAIIGGGDARACSRWAEHAEAIRVVYLNASCTSDELRAAHCSRAAFHVVPSNAMYRDASAMVADAPVREVVAWHPSLTRFGADTLNKRFHVRFGRPMTADAWAAWFAVKVIWESSLAARSNEAGAVSEYLERDTTKFDGHKGQPLSFRRWDHQLRQPVYAVLPSESGAQGVRELPEQSAGPSLRDTLDQLGQSAATSSCRFAR